MERLNEGHWHFGRHQTDIVKNESDISRFLHFRVGSLPGADLCNRKTLKIDLQVSLHT